MNEAMPRIVFPDALSNALDDFTFSVSGLAHQSGGVNGASDSFAFAELKAAGGF